MSSNDNAGFGSRDLFSFIRIATDAMRRVVLIRQGTGWGTGFLVGEDLLLTNRHVLESGNLQNYEVIFDYTQSGMDLKSLPVGRIKESLDHKPKEDLDFEVVRLDQKFGIERGFFRLSTQKPPEAGMVKVMLFGFPNKDEVLNPLQKLPEPLQYMPGEITTFINQPVVKRIGYSAETRKGASGTPIVMLTGDVIGLHHWGQKDFDNFGIPMFAIVDALRPATRSQLSVSGGAETTGTSGQASGLQSMTELDAQVAQITARVVPDNRMKATAALMKQLGSLNEVQFNQVLILLDAGQPKHDICTASVGETGPVLQRVPRLLNWLNTLGRPEFGQLLVALDMLGYAN